MSQAKRASTHLPGHAPDRITHTLSSVLLPASLGFQCHNLVLLVAEALELRPNAILTVQSRAAGLRNQVPALASCLKPKRSRRRRRSSSWSSNVDPAGAPPPSPSTTALATLGSVPPCWGFALTTCPFAAGAPLGPAAAPAGCGAAAWGPDSGVWTVGAAPPPPAPNPDPASDALEPVAAPASIDPVPAEPRAACGGRGLGAGPADGAAEGCTTGARAARTAATAASVCCRSSCRRSRETCRAPTCVRSACGPRAPGWHQHSPLHVRTIKQGLWQVTQLKTNKKYNI